VQKSIRKSGIEAVGDIAWGAHFCQFYGSQADLAETLVPYFEAGLREGESCLWAAGDQLEAQKAEALMTDAVPEFKKFLSTGQMEIVSTSDWYTPDGVFNGDKVLQAWIDKEAASRSKGFAGLRLTGDTHWIERLGWNDFIEYERKLNYAFRPYHLVALCTYCTESCTASDVIEACCEHQFALARRQGSWEVFESSPLKMAKDELMQANDALEARVAARTAELSASLHSQDQFLTMLGDFAAGMSRAGKTPKP
jgi:C4-dicarboxylate-specific signal transduction histidine kinase